MRWERARAPCRLGVLAAVGAEAFGSPCEASAHLRARVIGCLRCALMRSAALDRRGQFQSWMSDLLLRTSRGCLGCEVTSTRGSNGWWRERFAVLDGSRACNILELSLHTNQPLGPRCRHLGRFINV